jgi:WD40 repeat protein
MSIRAHFVVLALTATAAGQGRELAMFTVDKEVTASALDPNDKSALLGFANGWLVVFPTSSDKALTLHAFTAHPKAITAGGFLPDGSLLATASLDGTVKVWETAAARKHFDTMNATGGKGPAPIPTSTLVIKAHSTGVTALAVSADGSQFLTGGADGAVKLWEARTGKPIRTINGAHPGGVKAVLYRPGSDELVTAGADRTVKTWDAKKGSLVRKSEALKTPINGIALSPDGKKVGVATGTAKKAGAIKVLDADTLKEDFTLEGPDDVVTCVVFHPKTARLASGGADQMVRVWDLDGKKEYSSAANAEPIRGVAVTPDGGRFAAFSATRVRWFGGFGEKKE